MTLNPLAAGASAEFSAGTGAGAGLTDTWPRPADVGFQLAFAAGALVGAWTHREWYHKLLAPLATVGIVAYITALFTHLG